MDPNSGGSKASGNKPGIAIPVPTFQKKPGPASKTLSKFMKGKGVYVKGDPTNGHCFGAGVPPEIPGPSYSDTSSSSSCKPAVNEMDALLTQAVPFASPGARSISDCSGAGTGHSSVPTETLTLKKTECLLCSDVVNVYANVMGADDTKMFTVANAEKYKVIKTLCHYLSMSPMDVPHHYTDEMFPFCPTCDKVIEQIATSDRIIQEEKRKISDNILRIERIVTDSELLKDLAKTATKPETRFTKLRETVLDGKRNKLIMKKKLRESLSVGQNQVDLDKPSFPHTVVMVDADIERQFKDSSSGVTTAKSQEENSLCNITIDNVMSMFGNEMPLAPQQPLSNCIAASGDETSYSEDSVVDCDVEIIDVETVENVVNSTFGNGVECKHTHAPYPVNQPKKNRSNQHELPLENGFNQIVNDIDHNGQCPEEPQSSNAEMDLVDHVSLVKQEPLSPAASPARDGTNEGTIRRRRSIFRGVEIFKLSLPGRTSSLECGLCKYAVEILENVSGPSHSAYQSMTTHISRDHFNKTASNSASASIVSPKSESPKKVLPTNLVKTGKAVRSKLEVKIPCRKCTRSFETHKEMREHVKRRHSSNPFPSSNCVDEGSQTPHTLRKKIQAKASTDPEVAKSNKSKRQQPNNIFECDICGRPQLTSQCFFTHRYSHKNDKEKMEAIRNRERGAPSSKNPKYISKLGNRSKPMRKKPRNVGALPTKKPK